LSFRKKIRKKEKKEIAFAESDLKRMEDDDDAKSEAPEKIASLANEEAAQGVSFPTNFFH